MEKYLLFWAMAIRTFWKNRCPARASSMSSCLSIKEHARDGVEKWAGIRVAAEWFSAETRRLQAVEQRKGIDGETWFALRCVAWGH